MTATIVHPATIVNADVLKLIAWSDERLDLSGHDPRSAYVEQFWLGTLGPTTTWFLRHCAHLLEGSETATVDLREAASTLGVGHSGGARSAMVKTVARACRFRAARPVGSTTLAVRLRLPHLSHRQLQRLPVSVQQRHDEYFATESHADPINRQRLRARRLATSLIECGDEPDEAELHLARLQFHPAISADAVRWAWEQRQARITSLAPDAA